MGGIGELKRTVVKKLFNRYAAWRLDELMAPRQIVQLEYKIDPAPRYGYGRPPHPEINKIIAARADDYQRQLRSFLPFAERISRMADETSRDAMSPTYRNAFFSGLDAIAYYGLVATAKPKTILEIGSGFSTRFARQAIRDNGLSTRIVTCDPEPRAEVETISDEIVRVPFEKFNLSRLDELGENDILFIDSSHRCFTNSDVTIQFLEALPRLRPGTLIHQHDILLPYDYPPEWSNRYYSEQYLLATYLLGGSSGLEIVLPNAFVSKSNEFTDVLQQMWSWPRMEAVKQYSLGLYGGHFGYSFWTRSVARG